MNGPDNIVFKVYSGSVAYGLNHADSDVDTIGVFVLPTIDFAGFGTPKLSYSKMTDEVDVTYHEIGRFLYLLCKGNPTILETLFVRPDCLLQVDALMGEIVKNRSRFLSKECSKVYFGYATSQLKRFSRSDKELNKKQVRHACRLLLQGMEILNLGTLTTDVSDRKEYFAEIESFPRDKAIKHIEMLLAYFKEIEEASDIREHPDQEFAEHILLEYRKQYSGI